MYGDAAAAAAAATSAEGSSAVYGDSGGGGGGGGGYTPPREHRASFQATSTPSGASHERGGEMGLGDQLRMLAQLGYARPGGGGGASE